MMRLDGNIVAHKAGHDHRPGSEHCQCARVSQLTRGELDRCPSTALRSIPARTCLSLCTPPVPLLDAIVPVVRIKDPSLVREPSYPALTRHGALP